MVEDNLACIVRNQRERPERLYFAVFFGMIVPGHKLWQEAEIIK